MHPIVESNRYMTLSTADADGVPWASPVWYAPNGPDAFLWVSDPSARHSRNLAVRPQLALVIFDSQVVPGEAAAFYASGTGSPVDQGIETFSAHSIAQGLPEFKRADVTAPARLRLYRATLTEQWVLGPGDRRLPLA
jgi:pyridoxamine 5'-phosphate oxidase-like protein